jgi:hypothetical protein
MDRMIQAIESELDKRNANWPQALAQTLEKRV